MVDIATYDKGLELLQVKGERLVFNASCLYGGYIYIPSTEYSVRPHLRLVTAHFDSGNVCFCHNVVSTCARSV
jgi:hypothetical protein